MWGVGCRVWGFERGFLSFVCGVWGVGFDVWRFGSWVWGVGCGEWGVDLIVESVGYLCAVSSNTKSHNCSVSPWCIG